MEDATRRLMADVYKENHSVQSKLFLRLLKHMVDYMGTDLTKHFVKEELKNMEDQESTADQE